MRGSPDVPLNQILVDRDDLQVGMFLVSAAGKWFAHDLWRGNFLIDDGEALEKVFNCGAKQFWIDTARSRVSAPTAVASEPPPVVTAPSPPQPEPPEAEAPEPAPPPATPKSSRPRRAAKTSLESELDLATGLCNEAKAQVVRMMDDARLGKQIDVQACEEVVEPLVDSVARDANALLSLTRLRGRDEYTYMHSVTVCVLMTNFARELGLPRESLPDFALAGLLHDVGKALVPLDILNKPGKLTDEEFEIIKTHPARGEAFLRECEVTKDSVLDVCLHHHERIDGKGYPHGLSGDRFIQIARMGAICDVYDALTSDRCYKEGWRPDVALKSMSGWQGHFDRPLLAVFIRSIGIYPPTSLVRLASGRIGVVVANNPGKPRSPQVRVFYDDKRREPVPVMVVDLGSPTAYDEVVASEPRENWPDLDLEALVMA
jgi:HD-GYP domain-containing protein (c-di-GMP phosphodiesterase class II)